MSGPLLHCSPSTGSNFNQISKTATNLLNDIYEKHLLSQTRFENRPSLFAGDIDKLPQHAGILRPGQITGGTELMIKNNLRQRVPRKVSESVAMKIQKSLCEIQQNGMPAAAAAARKQPTGGNEVVVEAGVAPRSKFGNFVYGEHHQQQQHSAMMIMPMPQSKQYQVGGGADVNGKISVRAEPVGGNNFYHQDNLCDYSGGGGCDVGVGDNTDADGPAGAGNKYEHRNSKINIMLETAQAMAAAAYFARSVENIFYFICFL